MDSVLATVPDGLTMMTNPPSRRRFLAFVAMAAAMTSASAQAQAATFVVKDRKRVSGSDLIKVKRGDVVSLTVTSDAVDELHVHGYNLLIQLTPGTPGTLTFTAGRTGRFGFELHKTGIELGVIEVYPK